MDGGNQYTCVCGAGWSGGGVDAVCIDDDQCIGVTCGGAASSCKDGDNQYTCVCGAGWSGSDVVNTVCVLDANPVSRVEDPIVYTEHTGICESASVSLELPVGPVSKAFCEAACEGRPDCECAVFDSGTCSLYHSCVAQCTECGDECPDGSSKAVLVRTQIASATTLPCTYSDPGWRVAHGRDCSWYGQVPHLRCAVSADYADAGQSAAEDVRPSPRGAAAVLAASDRAAHRFAASAFDLAYTHSVFASTMWITPRGKRTPVPTRAHSL